MELPFIRDAGIRFDDGKIGIITLNVAEFNKSAQRCYEKCGFTIYDEMYKNGNRTSDVQAAQRFHDRINEPFKRIENERSPGNRCFKLLPGEFCTLNSFFLKKCKIG